ncbi:MAG: hypothetical protein U0Y68_02460 [Blastocatellia bacterium]
MSKRFYTFEATAGDRVALLIRGAERWSMTLIDPNGRVLADNFDTIRLPSGLDYYTLQTAGTYRVEIGEPVSSGAYRSRYFTFSLLAPTRGCQ